MSIIGVHVHLHDGELAKLAAYLIEGSLAALKLGSKKAKDQQKAHRRYEEALQQVSLMMRFLTHSQKEQITIALGQYVTSHLLFSADIISNCISR
jgi:hypothetical protein